MPVSQPTSMPSGSNQAEKFSRCCSARISVGAINATWCPASTTSAAARGRDHGLARADVPLHEAQHRLARPHVLAELAEHALLRAGRGEPERRAQRPTDRPGGVGNGRRSPHGGPGPEEAESEAVGDELLEREPAVGGMGTGHQRLDVRLGGRSVHDAERRGELGQVRVGPLVEHEGSRQPVDERALVEAGERLLGQTPERALLDALGGRVERRQRVLERTGRVVRGTHAVLGVDHLEHAGAAPHLPEALQPGAARSNWRTWV